MGKEFTMTADCEYRKITGLPVPLKIRYILMIKFIKNTEQKS